MAEADALEFPWYKVVQGDVLEQGDILLDCPYFMIPAEATDATEPIRLGQGNVNAIILTQSCDLAVRSDGECEAADIILARLYFKQELTADKDFKKDVTWEEVRKGKRPFFHVLNECKCPGHELDFMLVDFHTIFTLSVRLVRRFVASKGERIRLQPPYREHLAQSFARLFMRIGLPTDIPSFTGKKK